MTHPLAAVAAAAVLAAVLPAAAQTVTFNGSVADRMALLVIDGSPRSVAVGQTVQGVKLLAVADGDARVEIGGRPVTLRIGAAPVRVGAAGGGAGGSEIILSAGPGGHFTSLGSINGRSVQFMVDTGATLVSMSQADAERIGLDLRSAQRGLTTTANGVVPVQRVVLDRVRVGDVEIFNVEAAVVPAPLPYVLLGNSFLTRFQMKRENDRLTLSKRL